jgi:hypothetical protein
VLVDEVRALFGAVIVGVVRVLEVALRVLVGP